MWTKTAPTEPGLYHYRVWFNDDWFTGQACRITQRDDGKFIYHMTGIVSIHGMTELPESIEWWPVAIPRPEVTG
jgi:hypothetical protein